MQSCFISDGKSIAWAADNIAHDNMLFYPLYYDTISLTSLKITQAFHLLLAFAEIQSSLGILKFEIAFG